MMLPGTLLFDMYERCFTFVVMGSHWGHYELIQTPNNTLYFRVHDNLYCCHINEVIVSIT